MTRKFRILVLGGTTEARLLAELLAAEAGYAVTFSLAGRTAAPLLPACEVRIGGFGGAEGLAAYLRRNGVDLLVDATHPFAARISANAESAAASAGVKLVALQRPAWRQLAGDRWIMAADINDAAALAGKHPRKILLTIGRQELTAFRTAPQHAYVVRSVEPAEELLPGALFIRARGPFAEVEERALFIEHDIEMVVAKNSGGEAGYGKIAAARALSLPVIMVERPRPAPAGAAATVEEALARIRHIAGALRERGA